MGQAIGGSAVDLDLAIADGGGAASNTIIMGGQLGFIEYVEAHLRFTHSVVSGLEGRVGLSLRGYVSAQRAS